MTDRTEWLRAVGEAIRNNRVMVTAFCRGCGRRRGHVFRVITTEGSGGVWIPLAARESLSDHDLDNLVGLWPGPDGRRQRFGGCHRRECTSAPDDLLAFVELSTAYTEAVNGSPRRVRIP